MGSRSDWETLRHAADALDQLGVPHECRVVSAHRTPDLLFEYAAGAAGRGLEVLIAGAGGAAHLPGMAASKTSLPVLGVPVESAVLRGVDSLLSIVQMPAGVPVGTLAIGKAGAVNAALLAAAVVANKHPEFREALRRFRAEQTQSVLANPDPREPTPWPSAHSAAASSGACWRWPAPRWGCACAASTPAPTRRRPSSRNIFRASTRTTPLSAASLGGWTSSPSSSRTYRSSRRAGWPTGCRSTRRPRRWPSPRSGWRRRRSSGASACRRPPSPPPIRGPTSTPRWNGSGCRRC